MPKHEVQSLAVQIAAVAIIYPVVNYVLRSEFSWTQYLLFVALYSVIMATIIWWRTKHQ